MGHSPDSPSVHPGYIPQTLPACDETFDDEVGKAAGFSFPARRRRGAGNERQKLERLCRYIGQPTITEQRLSLSRKGKVRYQLKTQYRDGTTHVTFEPLGFIARLAALAPKPRVNLIRFHEVFTPNSKHRAQVTPAKRGRSGPYRSPPVRQRPRLESNPNHEGELGLKKRDVEIPLRPMETFLTNVAFLISHHVAHDLPPPLHPR